MLPTCAQSASSSPRSLSLFPPFPPSLSTSLFFIIFFFPFSFSLPLIISFLTSHHQPTSGLACLFFFIPSSQVKSFKGPLFSIIIYSLLSTTNLSACS